MCIPNEGVIQNVGAVGGANHKHHRRIPARTTTQ
jgi:hypothetical protein